MPQDWARTDGIDAGNLGSHAEVRICSMEVSARCSSVVGWVLLDGRIAHRLSAGISHQNLVSVREAGTYRSMFWTRSFKQIGEALVLCADICEMSMFSGFELRFYRFHGVLNSRGTGGASSFIQL